METVTLKASLRTDQGKGPARRLRALGRIPSVAYGKTNQGEQVDTVAIAIEADALRDILESRRGRNSIIDLDVEGANKVQVMLKDFTVHPLTRKLIHADFQRVDPTRPIEVEIPFVTVGKSRGEQAGGTLLVNERSLKLRCLPTNIPIEVQHDVSGLDINDEVKVKELALPANVEVLMAPERKLVVVQAPRVLAEAKAEGEAAPEAGAGDSAEKGKGASES
jgi:large subunit ribosomal protein L25